MAPNRDEFKRYEDEDGDDEIAIELEDEVNDFDEESSNELPDRANNAEDESGPEVLLRAIGSRDRGWIEEALFFEQNRLENIEMGSSDSDDSDSDESINEESDNDSDKDWEPEDVESETDSIKSLSAGREKTDEDDLIKIIKKAKHTKRQQPPTLEHDDNISCISFSPSNDIIAVGTIEGDVCLYSYDLEKTELIMQYTAHNGNCRHIEYDESGELLYSISDDKTIIVAESEGGKYRNFYDDAHENPIYSISIINENLFCTGDDGGVVKLWDRRKKVEAFSLKVCDEYISSLCSFEENSTIACTAGNGTVAGVNMNTRRIISKSEPYSADITCSGLFCSNTKLAVGTSVGSLLLYSWGQFSQWNDEFPAVDKKKHAINCLVPITENIAITGLGSGCIRATHLFPMRHIGVVGQHGSSIESMDINRDGTLIATSSIDNKVNFWNVEYFEEVSMTDKNKKDNDKARENNLPSSRGVNASDFFAGMA